MEQKNRVGKKYTTNEGYEVTIIEYFGALNCTIRFNDNRKTIKKSVIFTNLKKGNVTNPYHPSIYNIGYIGKGKYKTRINSKTAQNYEIWKGMLKRCYDKKTQNKQPTYKGCTVAKKWHNFQNFAKWFEENYVEGFQLDKDILFKGNKFYSSKTCCFVPQEINKLFTKSDKARGEYPIGVNFDIKSEKYRSQIQKREKFHLGMFNTLEEAFNAYKIAKELYIKEIANKWKYHINSEVYNTMLSYETLITD